MTKIECLRIVSYMICGVPKSAENTSRRPTGQLRKWNPWWTKKKKVKIVQKTWRKGKQSNQQIHSLYEFIDEKNFFLTNYFFKRNLTTSKSSLQFYVSVKILFHLLTTINFSVFTTSWASIPWLCGVKKKFAQNFAIFITHLSSFFKKLRTRRWRNWRI